MLNAETLKNNKILGGLNMMFSVMSKFDLFGFSLCSSYVSIAYYISIHL